MLKYDTYNREERAICAHLFRLLHEQLETKHKSPLGRFITRLAGRNPTFKNGAGDLANLRFENVGIFCEVAIIRDVYQERRADVNSFMDDLTRLVMKQEHIGDCRSYSELPEVLRDPNRTHPNQIRHKAVAEGVPLSETERRVYGALQGIFNAKPDLAITIDKKLLLVEAKFTEPFDKDQLERSWDIAQIWSTLLFAEFGFVAPPEYTVTKLGACPDSQVTWSDILDIAQQTYGESDRTRIAITAGADFLKRATIN